MLYNVCQSTQWTNKSIKITARMIMTSNVFEKQGKTSSRLLENLENF